MNTHGSRPLILIEIAVALCFFMIACAVLGSVFATAGSKGKSTICDSQALICAEDTIERFSAGDMTAEEFLTSDGWSLSEAGSYTVTRTFSGCDISYLATVVKDARDAGTIDGFDISASNGDDELFCLKARRYDPREVSA